MGEANTENPKPRTPQEETEMVVSAFPEELQETVRSFYASLAKNILAQQTTMHGDEPVIRVTPNQNAFYKNRFDEILESGLINPHHTPPVEIKDK